MSKTFYRIKCNCIYTGYQWQPLHIHRVVYCIVCIIATNCIDHYLHYVIWNSFYDYFFSYKDNSILSNGLETCLKMGLEKHTMFMSIRSRLFVFVYKMLDNLFLKVTFETLLYCVLIISKSICVTKIGDIYSSSIIYNRITIKFFLKISSSFLFILLCK